MRPCSISQLLSIPSASTSIESDESCAGPADSRAGTGVRGGGEARGGGRPAETRAGADGVGMLLWQRRVHLESRYAPRRVPRPSRATVSSLRGRCAAAARRIFSSFSES